MNIQIIGILVPVIVGLVAVAKEIGLPSRFASLVSLVFAVGITFLFTGQVSGVSVLIGIVTGLAASGLYSGTKSVVKG